MKSLHRIKAIAAYNGAREVLKKEMAYPAYMMLKESARGILSYIVEDSYDKEISDKTKLSRLLDLINEELLTTEQIESIRYLVGVEKQGLEGILTIPTTDLIKIKRALKELIINYLKEPV